jgi:tRNA nucleotidyltransferase/poly(A) polymerase
LTFTADDYWKWPNGLLSETPMYLVGGAVRDALLNRPSYDLDFVTPGEALKIARRLADDLGGAYFPLDIKRKVARVVLKEAAGLKIDTNRKIKVDISAYQGADLDGDLKGRDFTINAMALEVHSLEKLIDPLGGAQDLHDKQLRSCAPSSFVNDPVRILRAVRFAVDMNLSIVVDTFHHMQEAVPDLDEVSAERMRDELFRILALSRPGTSLRLLDKVGALEYITPEVCLLKEVQQSPPHVMDAWSHTLDTLYQLDNLLEILAIHFDPDKVANLIMGMVTSQLGRYRQQLSEHMNNALNPDRPHRGLLCLAGLYHDVGKPAAAREEAGGKIQFIGHEQIGSQLIEKRGQALKLSNLETKRLVTIVSHHMRPSLLSHSDGLPSRRAIYRFFKDTGAAGVDICFLSLADMLATYGPTLPAERWSRHLEVVRSLLGAWWEGRDQAIFPPTLVDGNELMQAMGIDSGPAVGYLLEAIREAQINKEINNQQEAFKLAEKLLMEEANKKTG